MQICLLVGLGIFFGLATVFECYKNFARDRRLNKMIKEAQQRSISNSQFKYGLMNIYLRKDK